MKRLFLSILLLATPTFAAEIYSFSLVPAGGSISGAPESTIGWGYSIKNESSSYWLVTSALDSGTYQYATPDLIFDFPIVAPGATGTVPFDASTSAGLYELTWDASAPLGFVNSGNFILGAQWWDGDPLSGGNFVSEAAFSTQPYSATVAPEPASTGVVALSLVLVTIGIIRRRTQSRPSSVS
jgi:hypothetical protein